MTAALGQWRISYQPGDWLLLAGPTSLVLLEPTVEDALADALWEQVIASHSLTDLADRLAAAGMSALPSFAALFWSADGMRSLIRGRIGVVDIASGDHLADGTGILTWSESALGTATEVELRLPGSSGSGGGVGLPFVVGAVRVSAVRLDAREGSRVVSPQTSPDQAPTEQSPASPPEPPQQAHPVPGNEALWGYWGDPAGAAAVGPDTEPLAMEEYVRAVASSGPGAELPASAPTPPTQEQDSVEAGPAGIEEASTEVMAAVEDDPLAHGGRPGEVQAVACQYGHLSPVGAGACRVCGHRIPGQPPRWVSRPPLAVLRASDGAAALMDGPVLIGRAPAVTPTDPDAHLMTVSSPGHDISRTHLRMTAHGWDILATDLDSTNGTVLVRPGSAVREDLPPGTAVPVELGSLLELGDGMTLLVDYPQ